MYKSGALKSVLRADVPKAVSTFGGTGEGVYLSMLLPRASAPRVASKVEVVRQRDQVTSDDGPLRPVTWCTGVATKEVLRAPYAGDLRVPVLPVAPPSAESLQGVKAAAFVDARA